MKGSDVALLQETCAPPEIVDSRLVYLWAATNM